MDDLFKGIGGFGAGTAIIAALLPLIILAVLAIYLIRRFRKIGDAQKTVARYPAGKPGRVGAGAMMYASEQMTGSYRVTSPTQLTYYDHR